MKSKIFVIKNRKIDREYKFYMHCTFVIKKKDTEAIFTISFFLNRDK